MVGSLALLFALPDAFSATSFSGSISVDTFWRAQDGPYDITADVTVRNGATLSVEAGTTLYLRAGANVTVERGALRLLGTATSPVVLTSQRDQGSDTPAPGDWGQLRFLSGTDSTKTLLQYASVRYGSGVTMQAASPTFNNVTIAGHAGPAISIDLQSSPVGTGNQAFGNDLNGILVPAGKVAGDVTWGLLGIPYVVASGLVEVGAQPTITGVEPNQIEQGAVMDGMIRGTRLSGAETVSFSTPGVQAQVLAGGTDTAVPVRITAAANAALGLASADVQVAAGKVTAPSVVTVIFPLPPISVTSITPSSIRRGESKSFAVSGANLLGAGLSVSGAGLTISGLQTTDSQATFRIAAAADATLGDAVLTFSNRGAAKGVASINVTVQKAAPTIKLTPAVFAVPPDNTPHTFRVGLSDTDDTDRVFTLTVADPSVAIVSASSFTLTAGQLDQALTVRGLKVGQTTLTITVPGLAQLTTTIYATPDFASINTSYATSVRVLRQTTAPPPQPVQVSPLLTRQVSLAKGRYISSVSPGALITGATPTDLVVAGAGLQGVTGVQVVPATGVTLGQLTVAADGRSVRVLTTVDANAPIGPRQVLLTGADQPYLAVKPGADRFLVTPPSPEVTSVDPVVVTAGATAVPLTIRGRNFQGVQAISVSPASGLTLGAPVVNADGTVVTSALTVALGTTPGDRIVTVSTPAGASSSTGTPANTLHVVTQVGATVTPITARDVRVRKTEPVAPPRTQDALLLGRQVAIARGSFVSSVSPTAASIGTTITVTVAGSGLNGVTAVQFTPGDGLTVGTPTIAPDGKSLTVALGVAANAPQTIRTVSVLAGASQLLFADPSRALFRVTTPQPELTGISPLYLQVGAAPITLTAYGKNFQNAQQIRVVPSDGLTISSLPTVNADGTQATVNIAALSNAVTGPRTVTVVTPAGETSSAQTVANTLTLVQTLGPNVTPVASRQVKLLRQVQAPPPVTRDIGPVLSRSVAVRRQTTAPPPPTQQYSQASREVRSARGPIALGVQTGPLVRNGSGVLTIRGVSLGAVDAVSLRPSDDIVIGSPIQVSGDGTSATVPITIGPSAATGPREVIVSTGASVIPFVNAAASRIVVAAGTPVLDSISPILASQGDVVTLQLRGQKLTGASAVVATPAAGVSMEPNLVVDANGTVVTVRLYVATDAPLGARVIQVVTPGGTSSGSASPSNTFTVYPP